jgi:DNA-binding MarR family transcriptional regulator
MSTVEPESHPSADLNGIVHQPARLGVLSILSESEQADFAYLKRALDLTDGNLSRHLEVLAGEGLVHITKGYRGKRPRTWVTITGAGRRALATEIATLQAIIARSGGERPESPG